jgi:Fe2+ transport system protein FeoA
MADSVDRVAAGELRSVRDLVVGETAILGVPEVDRAQRIRLAELGMRPGQPVTLVQRGVGGARVVSVSGSRIALDARTSGRIPVTGGGGA